MSAAYPAKWPVELTLRLRSGEAITRRLDEVKWSPERPPRFEEIADKFRMCAEPVIGRELESGTYKLAWSQLIGRARSENATELIGGLGPHDRLAPLAALIARPVAAGRSRDKPKRSK